MENKRDIGNQERNEAVEVIILSKFFFNLLASNKYLTQEFRAPQNPYKIQFVYECYFFPMNLCIFIVIAAGPIRTTGCTAGSNSTSSNGEFNLNDAVFLYLLEKAVNPALIEIMGNDLRYHEVIFQYDGASLMMHYPSVSF